jgi:hypothetical protein
MGGDAIMRKLLFRRGFTDKLYWYNFAAVQLLVAAVILLTALSGVLGVTDMSAVSTIPPAAYTELALHTGFIIWKAKAENCRKHQDKNMEEIEL